MMPRARATSGRLGGATLVLAIIAGLIGFGAIIVAHEANPKYVVVAFASIAIVVLMPLIGNARLFLLYGILILAPISLRSAFALHPHMGGAGALYIEAVDPFMLALFYIQVRDRMKGRREQYRFPRPLWIWVSLMGLGILSMAFAPLHTVAALELVRMLKLLVLALVVVNEFVTQRHFRHALGAILAGVVLNATLALVQNALGHQLGLEFLGEASEADAKLLASTSLESGEFVYRAGGLIGHANLLAAYLSLFLPVAAALVLTRSPPWLKLLSLIALAVGTPALVLTLSRAGWTDFLAGMAIAIGLGIAHPYSRRKFAFTRVAVVAATAAVAIALSPMIFKRLSEADPTSVEYRLKWINTARAMAMDNPVFGVGLNAYVYSQLPYNEFRTPVEMSNFYGDLWPVVHNSWLIVWSEQGTVGFLIWVWFHFSMLRLCVRNLRLRDPMMHALGVGLFGGFVAIMVDGLASFFVRYEPTARMFWIASAMIMALEFWRRLNEDEQPVPVMAQAPVSPRVAAAGGRWMPARPSAWR